MQKELPCKCNGGDGSQTWTPPRTPRWAQFNHKPRRPGQKRDDCRVKRVSAGPQRRAGNLPGDGQGKRHRPSRSETRSLAGWDSSPRENGSELPVTGTCSARDGWDAWHPRHSLSPACRPIAPGTTPGGEQRRVLASPLRVCVRHWGTYSTLPGGRSHSDCRAGASPTPETRSGPQDEERRAGSGRRPRLLFPS